MRRHDHLGLRISYLWQYSTGLGEKLSKPRNLAIMMLFSFEVDTLEIALRETLDLIDVFFLVESTKSHKGVYIEIFGKGGGKLLSIVVVKHIKERV